jgi:hypothetical protein
MRNKNSAMNQQELTGGPKSDLCKRLDTGRPIGPKEPHVGFDLISAELDLDRKVVSAFQIPDKTPNRTTVPVLAFLAFLGALGAKNPPGNATPIPNSGHSHTSNPPSLRLPAMAPGMHNSADHVA